MLFGIVSIIIGLVLFAVAGYGYYEEKEISHTKSPPLGQKYIPLEMAGMLYKYRMWLGIGGAVLLALGGGMMWYDTMEEQ